MKKQIFTLLIMLSLVAFTGKLFAQSTPIAPYAGTSSTYTVNGITPGSTYNWGVNASATTYVNQDAANADYEITTGTNGTVGSLGTASIAVNWALASATKTFFVWIQITDGDDCSTYRSLQVIPVVAPNDAYAVNYGILALRTGDETTPADDVESTTGGVDIDFCPAFIGEDFTLTTLAEAGSNGNSYIYFKISRSSALMTNATWQITPSLTSGTVVAGSWAYANNPDQTFNSFTIGSAITGIDTGNDLYIRAEVVNNTTPGGAEVVLSIGSGNDEGTTNDGTITHTASSASLTVLPVPAVGTFSLSN